VDEMSSIALLQREDRLYAQHCHGIGPSHHRLIYIDLLKALACSLIVLHHLAFYCPMADYVRSMAPTLMDGLADYGRIAVQVFLVMGGFLAARPFSNVRLPAAGPVS
jgi:peptidoglycan/LPS O-acetylase OafA/YrhL